LRVAYFIGKATSTSDGGFEHVRYETHGFAKHFWWIHVVGLIWTSEFILACQQFVIASSVAFWYFST
jgi:solute carrier family 44 protein 1 (choline transporter-like protein)